MGYAVRVQDGRKVPEAIGRIAKQEINIKANEKDPINRGCTVMVGE